VDAFTRSRFTGNPATVVLDADGLDEGAQMAIAREFSQAEVAFVSAAVGADHDVRLRFFNTRKEAPFVGHATIAAHAALLAAGRRGAGLVRQLSGTGIIDVCVREDAGTHHDLPGALIEFRQSVPELGAPLPLPTALRVAAALGLPAGQLHSAMPPCAARKGAARLLVPVGDSEALDALTPNHAALESLGIELGVDGFFLFSVRRDAAGLSTDSRMFCPALGILEDPVSGNAHAMLAAYLWTLGELHGSAAFLGRQGRQMKRPGEVDVRLAVEDGSLQAVHIGGRAVIVSDGTLAP
jgi:PhzF family phenazine biosynthesis protein